MTSINQMATYSRQLTRNTPSRSCLPDWVHKGFPFPPHPQQSALIAAHQEAEAQHADAVETVRFAVNRRIENPSMQDSEESIKECRKREEEAKKVLSKAERELREFINHTPQQRIKLIEVEIQLLNQQLKDARIAEQKYIEELLNDPRAAKARLDRLIDSSSDSEFSSEQLQTLRSLRGNIQDLEGRILNHQRDVCLINRLVDEQKHKMLIEEAINPVLMEFNQTCARLAESWAELGAIAGQHGIRLDTTDLRAPSRATFQPGGNVVHIVFKK